MGGIQKLIKIGTSRGIVIPAGWLKWQERLLGFEIKEVIVDGGDTIKVIIPPSYRKRSRQKIDKSIDKR